MASSGRSPGEAEGGCEAQIRNERPLVSTSAVWEGDGMQRREFIAYAGAAMSTAAVLPAFAQSPQQLDYNILSTTMVAEMVLAFLSQAV